MRSDRRGNFHLRYHFVPTAGVHRYAFRGRVRFERAYPYVLGTAGRGR